jgi:putative SOS response-associated peptidase YedK
MCGRYAISSDPDDLLEEFDARVDETGGRFAPRYNVAPTAEVPVVLERAPRQDRSAAPVRQLRLLAWGLVPSWAKGPGVGSRMINARCEGLLDRPAYRRAASARRCLVPADGWYEWQASPSARDARGKPRKQPFFVRPAGGGLAAFAGIYEFWRDPGRPPDDPQAWRTTFAVLTTAAAPGLAGLHDRMPLVLARRRWDQWLDPATTDPGAVAGLVAESMAELAGGTADGPTTGSAGGFAAHPVAARVGDVRQEDAALLAPAPVAELVGVVDPTTGEVLSGPR